jgi:transitional endoplasmic reticulum ATPase
MESMQQELVVKWYQDYGEWIRRVIFGLAIALLSYQLLNLWPAYNSGVIILCAAIIGLLGVEKPEYSLGVFFLAFLPSLLYGAGSLTLIFLALFLVTFFIPKMADTPLKVTLLLASPFALHLSGFFFVAIIGGLIYANTAVIQSVAGAIFGFSIALVGGWRVLGVLPSRGSWISVPARRTVSLKWYLHQLNLVNSPLLKGLLNELGNYAVSIIAGIIIISLTTRFVAILRKQRGIKQDAISVFIPTVAGSVVWALIANEIHPKLGIGIEIVLISLLAGVITYLVGRLLPSWGEQAQPVLTVANTVTTVNSTTTTASAVATARFRRASWDDIAGYDDVKEELKEAVQPYIDNSVREELERQGLPVVGGILLYGAPGTGKTLFGRVLASETNMRFFSVSGPEFISKWVGDSERKLREIFAQARELAPAMIFFDEVESFLASREDSDGQGGSSLVSRQVVATFLAEMDGALSRGDVLVVAATNHPDLIDSAAIRAGRFDKIIFIPPPDETARRAIFENALAKRNGGEAISIEPLISMTERFTAADITGILTDLYRAAIQQGRMVTQDEVEALFRQTKPTVTYQMLSRYDQMQDKFDRRSRTTNRIEVVTHEKLSWESIGGLEETKAALREAVELPLLRPELFSEWGVKPHKGVLLYGPPGCGKTMFAKVVSDTSNARFYTVNGPELLGGGPGAAEKRLRELFERARENNPAVIFFDEIDAVASSRDSYAGAVQGSVVPQLLTLMDGKDALNGVVVIAATNRPDQLDAALLRPGRFDRLIYIPLPDHDSRYSQWKTHLAGKPGAETLDYEEITAASVGYSGAEIQHIVNKVAMGSLKAAMNGEERKSLQTQDVVSAILSTPAQVPFEQVTAYDAVAVRLSR